MPNYMNFLGVPIQPANLYPVFAFLEYGQIDKGYLVSHQVNEPKIQLEQTPEKRSYDYYLKRLEQDFDAQKLGFFDEDEILADFSYYDDEMEHRPFELPKTLYDLGMSFDPKLADIICDDE
ncbi:hypothetical protein [Moraxella porci]|uniref:hypothetical protein n=1 Tax=Moraxella porci TaxID=1288392 RepID=UPI00244CE112|nr:hypothetical protein [Moraxella porci]MDH2274242.1 hypothetical protein [Moraxella porci]